eukprot:gene13312-16902_t
MDNELQRKDEEVKELVSKCRGLATELEVNEDLRLNIPNLRLFLLKTMTRLASSGKLTSLLEAKEALLKDLEDTLE